MSIRAIAQELYKCQAKVHKLEDQLEQANGADKETIRQQLRGARAELKVLKNMMEGRKQLGKDPKKSSYPFKF